MCSGAIVQARISRVVVGCMNPKAGCAGSIMNLLQVPQFNHQVELTTGVMGEECSQMMKTFFKELRQKNRADLCSFCALCVERISQALLWQLTQPRHPRGTREIPLSAASFPT